MTASAARKQSFPKAGNGKKTSARGKTNVKDVFTPPAKEESDDENKIQLNGRVLKEIHDQWHDERKKIKIPRKTSDGNKELNASRALEMSCRLFILLAKGQLSLTQEQTEWLKASLE